MNSCPVSLAKPITHAADNKMMGFARAQPILRPIIPVDRHILLGQITRQHPVAPAPKAERDLKRDLLLLHGGRDFRLIIAAIAGALVGDADAAEPDRELVAIGGLA